LYVRPEIVFLRPANWVVEFSDWNLFS
jgi:hypothetical protein